MKWETTQITGADNIHPAVLFIASVSHMHFLLAAFVVADFLALFGMLTTGPL